MAGYRSNLASRFDHEAKSLGENLRRDVMANNLSALLRFEDRNSMAFGVEARVPFLDHRVVEYVFALPADFRIRDGWTKWLLREAMRVTLPDAVAWRRDKKGFVTPEIQWLRAAEHRIAGMFEGDVASAAFLDPSTIRRVLREALFERGDEGSSVVWRWLTLELWLRGCAPF